MTASLGAAHGVPKTAAVSAPVPPAAGSEGAFTELRRRVRDVGLLERRASGYVWTGLWLAAALGGCLAVLILSDSILVQAANGAFLAFLYTHIGFLMHDAGHMQIFRRRKGNDLVGIVSANLLAGLSYGWWVDKHNRHHGNPNHLDHDPDIDFPVVAFCEEQAKAKKRPWRWVVAYQAFLFFPLLLLEALSLRAGTFEHLAREKVEHPLLEWSFLLIHYGLYFGVIFYFLDLWPAVAFIVASQSLAGLYTGAVFAPNHKGMPLYDHGSRPGFLERQVLTSRNVRGNPVTDFLFGGLNYQVEHHLFPSLQRNRLGEAQPIVRDFCRERGLHYAETGAIQSYREILRHLHRVSAPLRGRPVSSLDKKGEVP